MSATGCAHGGWRCWRHFASPLWGATCTANYCAARCSICPLEYLQLLATKEITSRDTVGIRGVAGEPPAAATGRLMGELKAEGQEESAHAFHKGLAIAKQLSVSRIVSKIDR